MCINFALWWEPPVKKPWKGILPQVQSIYVRMCGRCCCHVCARSDMVPSLSSLPFTHLFPLPSSSIPIHLGGGGGIYQLFLPPSQEIQDIHCLPACLPPAERRRRRRVFGGKRMKRLSSSSSSSFRPNERSLNPFSRHLLRFSSFFLLSSFVLRCLPVYQRRFHAAASLPFSSQVSPSLRSQPRPLFLTRSTHRRRRRKGEKRNGEFVIGNRQTHEKTKTEQVKNKNGTLGCLKYQVLFLLDLLSSLCR